jgi:CheY-like chemotaxis protein
VRTKTTTLGAVAACADRRESLHVLIVDDIQQFREMYARYLSHQGVGVTTAVDGREALELAQQYPPDAIVLDLAMPGMDGGQFLGHARNDRRLVDVPIVVLSAYGDHEKRRELLARGADSFLDKPCVPSLLLSEIRRATARRRPRARR